jgi:serine protease
MLLDFRRLLFPLIALILASCADPVTSGRANLNLDRRSYYFSPDLPTQTLMIRNVGTEDSILNWHISQIDPNLVISGPLSGSLKYAEHTTLTLTTKTQVTLTHKMFVINSNGGTQTIFFNFTKIPGKGLESCGSFPPQNSSQNAVRPQTLTPQGDFVPGQLLIKYRQPFSSSLRTQAALQQQAQRVEADYNLSAIQTTDTHRPALVSVSGDVLEMAKRLSGDPRVEYAEPNYYLQTLATTNDPLFSQQWALNSFGVPQAWDIETGDSNEVVVAVIDSGFDMDHEDLVSKLLPGCDFDGRDNDLNPHPGNTDRINHGTHVAGIVAASGNNSLGVAGVAYGSKVKILPVKVFEDQGVTGTLANLINAILWAAGIEMEGVAPTSFRADIINMSLGIALTKSADIQSLGDAIEKASNRGIILFAASGNGGRDNLILHPAADPGVIAIGSVDEEKQRSSFSNYNLAGRSVDFLAPGGTTTTSSSCLGIPSTIPNNQYGCLSGTSMASPFAAGVAALVLSQNPGLSAGQVIDRLKTTALFDPSYMNSSEYGAGIICADKALGASTICGQ